MTRYLLGSALAVLAAAVPAAAPAQRLQPAVVAVVDTARIARECNACRTAQTQLQQQVTQLQQRQQQLETPLKTEAAGIQQSITALAGKPADSALQQRIQALQGRQNTANQELQGREQTLRSTQAHILQQINTQLVPVVDAVMAARGASLVVDRGAALALSPTLDVTNDVLTQLNTRLTSISVTPLPQQPGQQQQPQGR